MNQKVILREGSAREIENYANKLADHYRLESVVSNGNIKQSVHENGANLGNNSQYLAVFKII